MPKRIVSSATRLGYSKLAKPLLFRQHPDKVHHRLVKVGGAVQSVPGVGQLPKLWSYQNEPVLSQQILGLTFRNPIGLSAGFDKNVNLPPLMKAVGFGFMIGGSVTRDPCDGNPGPWFHRLPKTKSLVVHAGLPNQGHEIIYERVADYSPKIFDDFHLSISAAKTNSREVVTVGEGIRDYTTTMQAFEQNQNTAMHEINISCPNTFGGEPFTTPARLNKLLAAVDELQLKKPVFVKMPIDLSWQETAKLLDVIVKHNVQGVTIGNLFKNRKNAKLKDPLPDSVRGNLSGLPTQQTTLDLIHKTYKKYGDKLVIIGVGGVFSARDAYAKIKAGASLISMITGVIFEGPQVVGQINRDLVKLLKADGYESVSQAVGVDHR